MLIEALAPRNRFRHPSNLSTIDYSLKDGFLGSGDASPVEAQTTSRDHETSRGLPLAPDVCASSTSFTPRGPFAQQSLDVSPLRWTSVQLHGTMASHTVTEMMHSRED